MTNICHQQASLTHTPWQPFGTERAPGNCLPRRRVVKMYKIQWKYHTEEEATWETEDYLNRHFPGFLGSTLGISISISVTYPISGRDSF